MLYDAFVNLKRFEFHWAYCNNGNDNINDNRQHRVRKANDASMIRPMQRNTEIMNRV